MQIDSCKIWPKSTPSSPPDPTPRRVSSDSRVGTLGAALLQIPCDKSEGHPELSFFRPAGRNGAGTRIFHHTPRRRPHADSAQSGCAAPCLAVAVAVHRHKWRASHCWKAHCTGHMLLLIRTGFVTGISCNGFCNLHGIVLTATGPAQTTVRHPPVASPTSSSSLA